VTIQQRIAAASEAEQAVREHCMCLRFETTGTHYRVIYPDGYFPQGVQASKRMGKAEALTRMLDVMERHWKASFP
jgi:hypothetical protein